MQYSSPWLRSFLTSSSAMPGRRDMHRIIGKWVLVHGVVGCAAADIPYNTSSIWSCSSHAIPSTDAHARIRSCICFAHPPAIVIFHRTWLHHHRTIRGRRANHRFYDAIDRLRAGGIPVADSPAGIVNECPMSGQLRSDLSQRFSCQRDTQFCRVGFSFKEPLF